MRQALLFLWTVLRLVGAAGVLCFWAIVYVVSCHGSKVGLAVVTAVCLYLLKR